MADDNHLTGLEVNVRRLRELHLHADDTDRPNAALLLGFALSDLVTRLPDRDPRLPELAREGLRRLDESAATTAEAARRRVLLRRYMPGTAPRPAPGEPAADPRNPVSNLDLTVLRPAMADMRSMMAAMRLLAPAFPERLGKPVAAVLDVFQRFDSGQWKSNRADAAADLRRLAADLDAAGLRGAGLDSRALSMMIRICTGTGPADWPPLAEIDELVTDLESDVDPWPALGPPFDAFAGMSRVCIAFLLIARVGLDVQGGVDGREPSWFDDTLQRLERARDHLTGAPAAFADDVQTMTVSINNMIAAVIQAQGRAGVAWRNPDGPAADPDSTEKPPDSSGADSLLPPVSPGTAAAGADRIRQPSLFDGSVTGLSWQALEGIRRIMSTWTSAGPSSTAMLGMTHAMEATFFNRWTPDQDHALEALQRAAEQLATHGESDRSDYTMTLFALALLRGIKWLRMSASPQPDDWPASSELAEAVVELEAALELLPRADRLQLAIPIDELAGVLHACTGLLLATLAQHESGLEQSTGEGGVGWHTRARDHFAKVPPRLLECGIL